MTVINQELRVEREGHRLTLTLDRPRARNALSTSILESLVEHATAAAADGVRVIVLRGEGPSFCAGADLHEYQVTSSLDAGAQHQAYARMSQAIDAFEALPVIKVARLHGAVVGAGLVLASVCEVRIADTTTRFSVPEVALGLPFSMAGFPRLARLVGLTRATGLMLTLTTMDADEAVRAGLVTKAVDVVDLERTVDGVADQLAALPDFLIADAVERIRVAGEHLLPAPETDVTGLVLASADPACQELSNAYADRILRRRTSKESRS